MTEIYTDRSRIELYQKCPRARYWGYEHLGCGIQPAKPESHALLLGKVVHFLVGTMLAGIKPSTFNEACILDVEGSYIRRSFPPGDDERSQARVDEQIALTTALVRSWALVRLPELKEAYDVLSVEREEEPYPLGVTPGGQRVLLMVRTDAVLLRKSDGALFVWNLKTTKRADDRWREQWKYDPQTLSELLPVEKRFGEKFSGVLVEAAIKGEEREYPKDSGQFYFDSPLIWAWHNVSGKLHPRGDWSAHWQWQDDTGSHTLGKGWKKEAVWVAYSGGVAAWIDWLYENDPNVLQEQFVPLPPILRSDEQVDNWIHQTVRGEIEIRSWTEKLLGHYAFAQHTGHGNCLWPSRCPYFGICWENADPDDRSLFQLRQPNHSTEPVVTGETNVPVQEM